MSATKIVIILFSFLITTAAAFLTSNIIIASLAGLTILQFTDKNGFIFPRVLSIFTTNIPNFLSEPEAFKLFASMMLLSGTLELLIEHEIVSSFITFAFPNLGTGVYLDSLLIVFGLIFSCDDTILLLWLSSVFKSVLSKKDKNYEKKLTRAVIITDGLTNTLPWLMPFSSEAAYLIYCLKDSSDNISTHEHSKVYLNSILTMFYPIFYLINLVVGIIIEIYVKPRNINSNYNNKNVIKKERQNKITVKKKVVCILSIVSFPIIIWAGYFINGYFNLEDDISIKEGILKYIYTILWSAESADALFNSSLVCFLFNFMLISRYSTKGNAKEVCKKGMDDMLEIMIITLLANCFSQKIKELGVKGDLEYLLKKYEIDDYIFVPLIHIVSIITTVLVGNSWFTIKIMIDLMIQRIYKNNLILSSIVSGAAFGDKITLLSESRAYFSSSYKIKIKKLTNIQTIKCWNVGVAAFLFGHVFISIIPLYLIYIFGVIFIVAVQAVKLLFIAKEINKNNYR